MRSFFLLPALLAVFTSGTLQAASAAAETPTLAPVSHNMCITPANWSKPFTHVYHFRNGATLVFIGVEHTQDPADETHRQIKTAFERYKPSFVLVEGASSTKSSSEKYRNYLATLAGERMDSGAVYEYLYAVQLAVNAGAQFSGWDFSPDQDYKLLVDDGFKITDALGAHLLRSRYNPFTGDAIAPKVKEQIHYALLVQPVASFDYAAWYRQAYGEQFDPDNGTPCGSGIGSKIVSDLSYRRNLNLTDLIDAHALPGQTILVEAGANHWLALKDWLQSRSNP